MSNHALSKQMELYNVQSNTGWGEDISYTQRSTSTTVNTRAMVQDAEYGEKKDNYGSRDAFENQKIFMSVELSFSPSKGDTIQYDSGFWIVEKWDGANGIYDIYTTSGTKHIGGRGRQ